MVTKVYLKVLLLCGMFLFTASLFLSPTSAATISMQISNTQIVANQSYSFGIYIDTQGENSTGADAHISYNSSIITITSITHETIYETYPTHTFNSSLIDISGLSTGQNPFNGSNGLFATVNFTAVSSGTAIFTFSYSGTTETTISLDGRNLLAGQPDALTLAVSQAVDTSGTPTPSGVIPKTGLIDDLANNKVFLGLALIILGMFGYIELKHK
jgi:hypothetical protein